MTIRRNLLAALFALPLTAGIAAAQPWNGEDRRRREWDRWREAERRRRMQEARHRHREWREEMWHEEQERAAWERRHHRG